MDYDQVQAPAARARTEHSSGAPRLAAAGHGGPRATPAGGAHRRGLARGFAPGVAVLAELRALLVPAGRAAKLRLRGDMVVLVLPAGGVGVAGLVALGPLFG
jgi:hypothetical protein